MQVNVEKSSPADMGPDFDRQVGSRYLLEGLIGSGAMGKVYRGRDLEAAGDGLIAVKMLRAELSSDHDLVARFVLEGWLLRKIEHPNVVRVLDLVAEAERFGIIMQFVAGGDLRQAIDLPCPLDVVGALGAQIADGLAAVHAAGIVHGDLKPENVLVERLDGGLRLTDFGVSRLLRPNASPLDGKTVGRAGSPGYLAPEVIAGAVPGEPADLYALGVVLYELLTGRRPFVGADAGEVLRAHLDEQVRRPELLPDPHWRLLRTLLDKDPSGRISAATAAAWLRDLTSAEQFDEWLAERAKQEAKRVTGDADLSEPTLDRLPVIATQDVVTMYEQSGSPRRDRSKHRAEDPVDVVPAVEAPAVEAPAVEAPAVEAPAVEAPAVEAPAVEAPVAEAWAVEVPAAEGPVADGAAPAVAVRAAEVPVVRVPAAEPAAVEVSPVRTPAVEVPPVDVEVDEVSPVDVPRPRARRRPSLVLGAVAVALVAVVTVMASLLRQSDETTTKLADPPPTSASTASSQVNDPASVTPTDGGASATGTRESGPTEASTTKPKPTKRPVVHIWSATPGRVSAYTHNTSFAKYTATVGRSTLSGGVLAVEFEATGLLNLTRPEATCVTVTSPGGKRTTLSPSSVSLTTDSVGHYAGILRYRNVQPGVVTLRYACRSDYTSARVGSLS